MEAGAEFEANEAGAGAVTLVVAAAKAVTRVETAAESGAVARATLRLSAPRFVEVLR